MALPVRRRLLFGLHTSAKGNAHAFGYSITITATFGIVEVVHPQPTALEVLGFAVLGVLEFSILNLVVALLVQRLDDEPETQRIALVATATDVVSVGLAVAAAWGVALLLPATAAWLLSSFVAGLVYVIVQSVEFATAHQVDEGS